MRIICELCEDMFLLIKTFSQPHCMSLKCAVRFFGLLLVCDENEPFYPRVVLSVIWLLCFACMDTRLLLQLFYAGVAIFRRGDLNHSLGPV